MRILSIFYERDLFELVLLLLLLFSYCNYSDGSYVSVIIFFPLHCLTFCFSFPFGALLTSTTFASQIHLVFAPHIFFLSVHIPNSKYNLNIVWSRGNFYGTFSDSLSLSLPNPLALFISIIFIFFNVFALERNAIALTLIYLLKSQKLKVNETPQILLYDCFAWLILASTRSNQIDIVSSLSIEIWCEARELAQKWSR